MRPMVGPSKILTVSYGTFSCTLEGFDDPFGTMKAIAEYFRDLAAEDRYFGAEPPVPDAAMLHRIAEREIQRRVEARVEAGGVVLRAADPAATATTAPPAAAPAPEAARPPRLHPAGPGIEESIAAKLARIRAAVDRARIAPAPASEIEDAEEISPAISPAAGTPGRTAPGPAAPAVPPAPDAAAPAVAEAHPASDPPAPGIAPVAAVAAAAETAPARPEPAASEPAMPEARPAVAAAAPEEAAEPPPPAIGDLPLAPPAAETPAETGDPDFDALMGRLAAAPEAAPMAERGEKIDAAAADAGASPPLPGGAPLPAPERPGEAPAATTDPADADTGPDATPDAAPVVPVRARVIKVSRVERPAAGPAGEAVPPAARLSPEEEADLARELAEVEREMAAAAPTPPAPLPVAAPPPAPEAEAEAEPAGRRTAGRGPAADAPGDAAVNRLMRQADSEMDGAETRRRAATIAHLKAAVAATVAERAAGPGQPAEARDRSEAYRDDLAHAVRPRRPEALPGTGRRRPDTGARIPPLVLVSEQRIDRPAAAPALPAAEPAPVRPRRITTGSLALTRDLDAAAEDADALPLPAAPARFAEVAERLGAAQLPELIEAAAVYVTVIEGRDSFSRPRILRLAASLAGAAAPEREDSLRAFGLLLRESRIEKARRGQFALAEGNRMLAKARAAFG